MGIVTKARELLGGDTAESESDGKLYTYECKDCERVFDSPKVHIYEAECPDCGSPNLQDYVA